MFYRRSLLCGLASMLLAAQAAAAQPSKEGAADGSIEGLTCFQKGQQIFKAHDRVREFNTTNEMPLIAEVSLGQVRESRVKLYASQHADVVCVTTTKD